MDTRRIAERQTTIRTIQLLGAEWVEKTDRATGKKYFYNKVTGATEWKDFVDADGDGFDDRWAPEHAEDWKEVVDPNTGDVYRLNEKTGERTGETWSTRTAMAMTIVCASP